ncbi:MAG: RHS repeat-associated core domain-containing protein [Candidatus Heimdallarchaeaceae archaeon]
MQNANSWNIFNIDTNSLLGSFLDSSDHIKKIGKDTKEKIQNHEFDRINKKRKIVKDYQKKSKHIEGKNTDKSANEFEVLLVDEKNKLLDKIILYSNQQEILLYQHDEEFKIRIFEECKKNEESRNKNSLQDKREDQGINNVRQQFNKIINEAGKNNANKKEIKYSEDLFRNFDYGQEKELKTDQEKEQIEQEKGIKEIKNKRESRKKKEEKSSGQSCETGATRIAKIKFKELNKKNIIELRYKKDSVEESYTLIFKKQKGSGEQQEKSNLNGFGSIKKLNEDKNSNSRNLENKKSEEDNVVDQITFYINNQKYKKYRVFFCENWFNASCDGGWQQVKLYRKIGTKRNKKEREEIEEASIKSLHLNSGVMLNLLTESDSGEFSPHRIDPSQPRNLVVKEDVDLYTGSLFVNYPLKSLPGRNGMNAQLSLSYNSYINQSMEPYKQSPIGLGWSYHYGFIYRDMNNTASLDDDTFYLVMPGSTTREKLIYAEDISENEKLFTTEFEKHWIIIAQISDDPYNIAGIINWTLRDGRGRLYYFNHQRFTIGTYQSFEDYQWYGKRIVYQWDLTKIEDLFGNKVTLDYIDEIYPLDSGIAKMWQLYGEFGGPPGTHYCFDSRFGRSGTLHTMDSELGHIQINDGGIIPAYTFVYENSDCAEGCEILDNPEFNSPVYESCSSTEETIIEGPCAAFCASYGQPEEGCQINTCSASSYENNWVVDNGITQNEGALIFRPQDAEVNDFYGYKVGTIIQTIPNEEIKKGNKFVINVRYAIPQLYTENCNSEPVAQIEASVETSMLGSSQIMLIPLSHSFVSYNKANYEESAQDLTFVWYNQYCEFNGQEIECSFPNRSSFTTDNLMIYIKVGTIYWQGGACKVTGGQINVYSISMKKIELPKKLYGVLVDIQPSSQNFYPFESYDWTKTKYNIFYKLNYTQIEINGKEFFTLSNITVEKLSTNSGQVLGTLPPTKFEYYTSQPYKGLLKRMTYPTGGSVIYEYENPGEWEGRGVFRVINKKIYDYNNELLATFSYTYSNQYYHQEDGILGHGETVMINPVGVSNLYYFYNEPEQDSNYKLKGTLLQVTALSESGETITESYDYELITNPRQIPNTYFKQLNSETIVKTKNGNTVYYTTEFQDYDYGQEGFGVPKKIRYSVNGNHEEDKIIEKKFWSDFSPEKNILNKVEEIKILDDDNNLISKVQYTYYTNNGKLKEIKRYNLQTGEIFTSIKSYNEYGNIKTITNPRGNTVSFGYDENNLFIVNKTNELFGLMWTKEYSPFGELLKITDANGAAIYYTYDIFGRRKKIRWNDQQGFYEYYNYDDFNQPVSIEITRKVQDNKIEKIKYFYDGLGRPIQVQYEKTNHEDYEKVGEIFSDLNDPRDVVVDSYGFIYVADKGQGKIKKFSPFPELNQVGVAPVGDDRPVSMDIDNNEEQIYALGNYIDQFNNYYIDIIPLDLDRGEGFGQSTGSGPGEFYQPNNLAIDDSSSEAENCGNACLYVADTGNNRIQKFAVTTHQGYQQEFLLQWTVNDPKVITTDDLGYVYVGTGNNYIKKFGPNGNLIWSKQVLDEGNIYGIVIDDLGNIYITTFTRIIELNNEGDFIKSFGEGELGTPMGIEIYDNLIFTADPSQSRVFIFSRNSNNEETLVQHIKYNELGLKEKISKPKNVLGYGNYIEPNWNNLNKVEYTYDGFERLTQIKNYDGTTVNYEYGITNNENEWKKVIDENGHATIYYYDAYGQLVKVKDALNQETTYEYDILGNLIQINLPNGKIITRQHNSLGQLVKEEHPDTGMTRFWYDENGNIKYSIDANGNVKTFDYDALDRITEIHYANRPNNKYYYDSCQNGIGRLCKIEDASGIAQFNYDNRGRLISETKIIDENEYAFNYEYSDGDYLKTVTDPFSREFDYDYNILGQIENVNYNGNNLLSFAYSPTSMLEHINYGNGVSTSFYYNVRDFLNTIDSSLNDIKESYTYDNNGNILAICKGITCEENPYRMAMIYDNMNRLSTIQDFNYLGYGSGVVEQYTYDKLGNRKTIKPFFSSQTEQYLYYTDDRMLLKPAEEATTNRLAYDPITETQYWYDANGNLIQESSLSKSKNLAPNPDFEHVHVGGVLPEEFWEEEYCQYSLQDNVIDADCSAGHLDYAIGPIDTSKYKFLEIVYDINGNNNNADLYLQLVREDGTTKKQKMPSSNGKHVYLANLNLIKGANDCLDGSCNSDILNKLVFSTPGNLGITIYAVTIDREGAPNGWKPYEWLSAGDHNPDSQYLTYSLTTDSYSGNYSLQMNVEESPDEYLKEIASMPIILKPGYLYKVSAYLKTNLEAGNAYLKVGCYDDEGNIEEIASLQLEDNQDWHREYLSFTMPSDKVSCRIIFSMDSSTYGTLTLDRVQLESYPTSKSAGGIAFLYETPVMYYYDEDNNLVKLEMPDKQITYVYDANGNRIKKLFQSALDNKTVIYLYGKDIRTEIEVEKFYEEDDNFGSQPRFLDRESIPIILGAQNNHYPPLDSHLVKKTSKSSYLTLNNQIFARIEEVDIYHYNTGSWELGQIKKYYYHNNWQGSPIAITDESGQLVWRARYEPFGKPVQEQVLASNNNELNKYKFNAKELDEDSRLYYYGARYYSHNIGRFISADNVRGNTTNPQSFNLYVYTLNNPLRYVDSTGKKPYPSINLYNGNKEEIVREIHRAEIDAWMRFILFSAHIGDPRLYLNDRRPLSPFKKREPDFVEFWHFEGDSILLSINGANDLTLNVDPWNVHANKWHPVVTITYVNNEGKHILTRVLSYDKYKKLRKVVKEYRERLNKIGIDQREIDKFRESLREDLEEIFGPELEERMEEEGINYEEEDSDYDWKDYDEWDDYEDWGDIG